MAEDSTTPDQPEDDWEPTGTVLDSLKPEERPYVAPSWKKVKDKALTAFSALDPAVVQKSFEQTREMTIAHALASLKTGETPGEFLGRRSVPFVSSIGGAVGEVGYGRAKQRYDAGNPEPGDYDTIAQHERQQKIDASRGLLGKAISAAAHVPAIAGEFAVGGALLKGAGAALGLGAKAAEAGAAPAASFFTRQGLKEAAGRLVSPTALGRAAALTPLAPSMYAEHWAKRNIEEGRDPTDWRGLPPAMALGVLQTHVLGSMGAAGQSIPGSGLGAWAQRVGAGTAQGMVGSEAASVFGSAVSEVLPKAYKLETDYGLLGDAVNATRGKKTWGEAGERLFLNAVTFAAFSALHAPRSVPFPGEAEPYQQPALGHPEEAGKDFSPHELVHQSLEEAKLFERPAKGKKPLPRGTVEFPDDTSMKAFLEKYPFWERGEGMKAHINPDVLESPLPPGEAILNATRDALNALKDRGLASEGATRRTNDLYDSIGQLTDTNPAPSRAEVLQHLRPFLAGPMSKLARALANTFPVRPEPFRGELGPVPSQGFPPTRQSTRENPRMGRIPGQPQLPYNPSVATGETVTPPVPPESPKQPPPAPPGVSVDELPKPGPKGRAMTPEERLALEDLRAGRAPRNAPRGPQAPGPAFNWRQHLKGIPLERVRANFKAQGYNVEGKSREQILEQLIPHLGQSFVDTWVQNQPEHRGPKPKPVVSLPLPPPEEMPISEVLNETDQLKKELRDDLAKLPEDAQTSTAEHRPIEPASIPAEVSEHLQEVREAVAAPDAGEGARPSAAEGQPPAPAAGRGGEAAGNVVADAVRAHEGEGKLASLVKIRQHMTEHGITDRAEQDRLIQEARKQDLVTGSNLERNATPEQLAAALKNGEDRIGFLSMRQQPLYHTPPRRMEDMLPKPGEYEGPGKIFHKGDQEQFGRGHHPPAAQLMSGEAKLPVYARGPDGGEQRFQEEGWYEKGVMDKDYGFNLRGEAGKSLGVLHYALIREAGWSASKLQARMKRGPQKVFDTWREALKWAEDKALEHHEDFPTIGKLARELEVYYDMLPEYEGEEKRQMPAPGSKEFWADVREMYSNSNAPRRATGPDQFYHTPPHGKTGAGGTGKEGPNAYQVEETIFKLADATRYVVGGIHENPQAGAALDPQSLATRQGRQFVGRPDVAMEEASHKLAVEHGFPADPATLPPDVARGLTDFWRAGAPLSKSSVIEGLAQWMVRRAEGQLSNLTPQQRTADAFAEAWARGKGLDKPLDSIRDVYKPWYDQDRVTKYGGTINYENAAEQPLIGPTPQETAASLGSAAMTRWVDRQWPVVQALADAYARAKSLGKTLTGQAANAVDSSRAWVNQSVNLATHWMRTGVPRQDPATGNLVPASRPLVEILQGLKPGSAEEKRFNIYAKARDMVTMRQLEDARVASLTMTEAERTTSRQQHDDAQDVLRDLRTQDQAQYNRFDATHRELVLLSETMLDLLGDVGARSRNDIARLKANNPDHVSRERVFDQAIEDFLKQTGAREKFLVPRSMSEEQTRPYTQTIQERHEKVAAIVTRQWMDQPIRDLLRQDHMGNWAREMSETPEEPHDDKQPIWASIENGKRVRFMLKQGTGLDDYLLNRQGDGETSTKIARALASNPIAQAVPKMIRMGAVGASLPWHINELMPTRSLKTFAANTMDLASVKDLPSWLAQWGQVIWNGAVAHGHEAKPYVEFWENLAGMSHHLLSQGETTRTARGRGNLAKSWEFDGFGGLAQEVLRRIAYPTVAPRALEARNMLKKLGVTQAEVERWNRTGEMPAPAVMEAVMLAGAEVGHNYIKSGYETAEWNKTIPFLRAHVANTDKWIRNWKANPVGAATGLGILMAMRTAYWAWRKDDQDYQEQSVHTRNDFILPTPLGRMKIAGPRGLDVPIGALIDETLRLGSRSNPHFDHVLATMLETASPGAPQPLGIAGNLLGNRDQMGGLAGHPIVPKGSEGQPGAFLKHQAPFLAQAVTGGMLSERTPLALATGGFHPGGQPHQSVSDYYERLHDLEAKRIASPERRAGKRFPEEAQYQRLHHYAEAMTGLRKALERPNLDPERERVIRDRQIAIARRALEAASK